ncbi:MAG: FIST N-terminal domain-containing protein [Planctomycetota bacterium]
MTKPLSKSTSNLETFRYEPDHGWSIKSFPALDSKNTLVLVFGARRYLDDPARIQELRAVYPHSVLAGCSTSGEICGGRLYDESLSVAVHRFQRTRLRLVTAPIRSQDDSFHAGDAIARQLEGSDLRAVLVLSDGLKVNGSELVRGLNSVLPQSVVVTGGLAGDGSRFQRTWVLRDGLPSEGFVSAIGFYGDHVRVGHGCKGGWDVFGPERSVTRSEGNVLFELDNQPALPLYKNYLGERASELPAAALLFPLALRKDAKDTKRLVRTILSVDEARQAMIFAGDIPQGYLVQLMRANFDRLIDGAATSAKMARTNGGTDNPVLVIAISCVGRRLVLGERTEEELDRTLDAFPSASRQVGFYSYGEISPFATGNCDLHNQTMTLTTLSEI